MLDLDINNTKAVVKTQREKYLEELLNQETFRERTLKDFRLSDEVREQNYKETKNMLAQIKVKKYY